MYMRNANDRNIIIQDGGEAGLRPRNTMSISQ